MAERIFFRGDTPDYGVMADRHKQVIGVTGIGRGAGATFVAMGLAVSMGEMAGGVTFTEGSPCSDSEVGAYRMLSVDRRIDRKRFETGDGSPGSRTNIYRNVNWAVQGPASTGAAGGRVAAPAPGAVQDRGTAPDCRLLPGKHIIVDRPQIIEDMDLLVCVVDPLPSRIMAGLETFRTIKEQQLAPVIWVMNKNNSCVSRREVETFLRIKFTHTVPLLPADTFYRAEFKCSQPFFEQGMDGAEKAFSKLAEEILMHN